MMNIILAKLQTAIAACQEEIGDVKAFVQAVADAVTRLQQSAFDAAQREVRDVQQLSQSPSPQSFTLTDILDVTDTIVVPSGEGYHLRGLSMRKTGLRWKGPPDRPMFLLRDMRDSVFENFSIEAANPLRSVFEIGPVNLAPGRIVTSNNHRKRIYVQGHDRLGCFVQYGGVGYDGWNYPNVNNEANIDEDCIIENCEYGIKFYGNQCKDNVVNRCRFSGGTKGKAAIYSTGSFASTFGGGYGFETFFLQADTADTLMILAPSVEACGRLLHARGPDPNNPTTGAPQSITLYGGRFMCDALHADRKAIMIHSGGDCDIRNIQLGLGEQPIPCIALESFLVSFVVANVDFGSYGSTPGNSFFSGTSNYHFDIGFNTYRNPDGSPNKIRGIPAITDIANYQTAR